MEVAVTDTAVCALGADGRVSCGAPSPDEAPFRLEPVVGLPVSAQIVGTAAFFCARSSDGRVGCVMTPGGRVERPTPVVAEGSLRLSASGSHACSIDRLGRATCFSRPEGSFELPHPFRRAFLLGDSLCDAPTGQAPRCWPLEKGDRTPAETLLELVGPLAPDSRVVSGERYACALSGGTARCSGADAWGAAHSPEGLGSLAQIAAADHATCALTTDSRLYCWGRIRPDFPARSTSPAEVQLPAPARALVAGDHQSCARLADDHWYCWGQSWSWGSAWEVGGWPPAREPPPHRFAPRPLTQLDAASNPFMGGGFACWTSRGSVSCLTPEGASEGDLAEFEPLRTVRVGSARRAWAGGDLVCLNAASGTTTCVQPSDPDATRFSFGRAPLSDVRMGPDAICALTGEELRCYDLEQRPPRAVVVAGQGSLFTAPSSGSLWRAERGARLAVEWSLEPPTQYRTVQYPGPIRTMAGFFGANCVVLHDATAWCGGDGRATAEQVLTDVADLVAGQRSFCARTRDGAVHCWGNNSTGQLGLGKTPYTSTPQSVYPAP